MRTGMGLARSCCSAGLDGSVASGAHRDLSTCGPAAVVQVCWAALTDECRAACSACTDAAHAQPRSEPVALHFFQQPADISQVGSPGAPDSPDLDAPPT